MSKVQPPAGTEELIDAKLGKFKQKFITDILTVIDKELWHRLKDDIMVEFFKRLNENLSYMQPRKETDRHIPIHCPSCGTKFTINKAAN